MDGSARTLDDRFRLDVPIGRGGCGEVWRGFDLHLRRPVAVKLSCSGAPPATPGGTDGFLAEARRVAQLRHPGIVPVFDCGRHDGSWFIVSELVEGIDLGRWAAAGPRVHRDMVRVVAEVAEALSHAHAHSDQMLHLDIKPGNVLIDADGRTRLTDFGISLRRSDVSQVGVGFGTEGYMAPEHRAREVERVGPATDVYSLGVVLAELLTRRRPQTAGGEFDFDRVTAAGVWEVPRSVVPILTRCLAVDPADRFPMAADLAGELRQVEGRLLTADEWRASRDDQRMSAHGAETCAEWPRKVPQYLAASNRLEWPTAPEPIAAEVHASPVHPALVGAHAAWNARRAAHAMELCDVWRDLIGPDQFAPPPPRPWQTHPDAVAIARDIAVGGDFHRIPDLGVALERMGCQEPVVLAHCRDATRHYRGCWLLDLFDRQDGSR